MLTPCLMLTTCLMFTSFWVLNSWIYSPRFIGTAHQAYGDTKTENIFQKNCEPFPIGPFHIGNEDCIGIIAPYVASCPLLTLFKLLKIKHIINTLLRCNWLTPEVVAEWDYSGISNFHPEKFKI